METKNLFLAAILLVGMNCPINTNTADTGGTDVVGEYLGKLSTYLPSAPTLNPVHDARTIGAVAALGFAAYTHQKSQEAQFTQGEIGSIQYGANEQPDKIKIEVRTKATGRVLASTSLTWDNRKRGDSFISAVNQALIKEKLTQATCEELKFFCDITLEIKNTLNKSKKRTVTLTSKENPITLTKDMIAHATTQKTFGHVLWHNAIAHYFMLAETSIKADGSKKDITDFVDPRNFDLEYKAEINNKQWVITPQHVAAVLPLAAAAWYFGAPTNCSWNSPIDYTSAAAWLTGYGLTWNIAKTDLSGTIFDDYGVDIGVPTRKTEETIEVTDKQEFDAALNAFLLDQSTGLDADAIPFRIEKPDGSFKTTAEITPAERDAAIRKLQEDPVFAYEQWRQHKERLKTEYNSTTGTSDRSERLRNGILDRITEHAKATKHFAINKATKVTDKISGLEFIYTPGPDDVDTGCLADRTVLTSDSLLPTFQTDSIQTFIKTFAGNVGNTISGGVRWLSPFKSEEPTRRKRRVDF